MDGIFILIYAGEPLALGHSPELTVSCIPCRGAPFEIQGAIHAALVRFPRENEEVDELDRGSFARRIGPRGGRDRGGLGIVRV
jgi:hypothetical protein